jgi:NADH-quinone oxidoreductase subunit H
LSVSATIHDVSEGRLEPRDRRRVLIVIVVTQLVVFLAKVMLVSSFQILIRWSLPRFRWDQLLAFAWKFMFPLALANLLVTAVVVWMLQR